MCQAWTFSCGHTVKVDCQDYENRLLMNRGMKDTRVIITEEDDPFVDAGTHFGSTGTTKTSSTNDPFSDASALPRIAKESNKGKGREQYSRMHSNSNPLRPPQFLVVLPMLSPTKSEPEARFSTAITRGLNLTSQDGPGPAVANTDSPQSLQLPPEFFLLPKKNVICGGPILKKRAANNECYACILENYRNDPVLQESERAAAAKLHAEIKRKEEVTATRDTEQRGTNRSRANILRNQAAYGSYRHNAIDLGHNAIDFSRQSMYAPTLGSRRPSSVPTILMPGYFPSYNSLPGAGTATPTPTMHYQPVFQPINYGQQQQQQQMFPYAPTLSRPVSPGMSNIYTPSEAEAAAAGGMMTYQPEPPRHAPMPQHAVNSYVNQYLEAQLLINPPPPQFRFEHLPQHQYAMGYTPQQQQQPAPLAIEGGPGQMQHGGGQQYAGNQYAWSQYAGGHAGGYAGHHQQGGQYAAGHHMYAAAAAAGPQNHQAYHHPQYPQAPPYLHHHPAAAAQVPYHLPATTAGIAAQQQQQQERERERERHAAAAAAGGYPQQQQQQREQMGYLYFAGV
jgi:hypothetical protein